MDEILLRLTALEDQMRHHAHKGITDHKVDAADLFPGITASSAVYFGKVTSAGAASTPFPTGWSVAHTGTGRYTITHNLGTSAYVVVATNFGSFSDVCSIVSQGANSFELDTYDNTVGATWPNTDVPFMFILAK